jgi:antitoxin VapB
MSLNIKNKEAHRLAQELAKLTGESMAEAVTKAVRERLERARRERVVALSDRLLEIGKDCAAHLKEPFRTIDHGHLVRREGTPAMILDTSAIIVILRDEIEAPVFAKAVEVADHRRISAVNYVEAGAVIDAAETRSRAAASMTCSAKHKWQSSLLLKLRRASRARLIATSARTVASRPS